MSSTGYDDQEQAAIRDASRWVDTNEHVGGWVSRDDLPPGPAALVQRFEDTDIWSHTACERIMTGGPQVVHWFTEWPTCAHGARPARSTRCAASSVSVTRVSAAGWRRLASAKPRTATSCCMPRCATAAGGGMSHDRRRDHHRVLRR
jgi:hypothetical protein